MTRTIFEEATETLATRQWGPLPDSAHNEHHFDHRCKVCRLDVRAMTAVVLRVAEDRIRAMLAHYPEDVFPGDGTSVDAISAHAMRHAYATAAGDLGAGLPPEVTTEETNDDA